MNFVKMNGAGNDYIFITENSTNKNYDYSKLARTLSDRHYSIGSDGLVVICPLNKSFLMRIFNSDGSEAEMCGNAIRCVGKYLYDFGFVRKSQLYIETNSGVKVLYLNIIDDTVVSVKVNMGRAETDPQKIPAYVSKDDSLQYKVRIDGKEYTLGMVNIGNPHCVVFEDDIPIDWQKIAEKIGKLAIFPQGINIEFVKVISKNTIKVKVFERGCGVTLACGTGASASAFLANKLGYCDNLIKVELDGGTLDIEINKDNEILMSGDAKLNYVGTIEI